VDAEVGLLYMEVKVININTEIAKKESTGGS